MFAIDDKPQTSGLIGRGRRRLHILLSRPGAVAGLIVFSTLIVLAISAPLIAPYDPLKINYGSILQAPSQEHLFGTDDLGRDILSRILWGARESLWVAVAATFIGASSGLFFGLVSGYFGGWTDTIIQRFVDTLLAFPTILLVLSIIAVLGPSLTTILIAAGISIAPIYARMVRSTVLVEREKEYVLASRALGARDARILWQHILPNVFSVMAVYATIGLGSIIIAVAGLSYVGLGAQPPTPEWGAMLIEGQRLFRSAWWPAFFPGMAIFITVASINLLGDGLRDALDPNSI